MALGGIQDAMAGLLATPLPLIGTAASQTAVFIRNIRTGFLSNLRRRLSSEGDTIPILKETLFELLNNQLHVLQDTNLDGVVNSADIEVRWYDRNANRLTDSNGADISLWSPNRRLLFHTNPQQVSTNCG
jgi:hypothetical protein